MRSRDILDLLTKPATPMARGAAMAANRFAPGSPGQPTRAQRQLLEAIAGREVPPMQVHTHPAHVSAPIREPGPLTPVELAWLARFPAQVDPATVSFEDAKALAALDRTVDPMKLPADSRLVRAVWAPVKEFHDRAAAEAAVANASRPLPPVPPSALEALTDAIATEHEQLTRDEAAARARTMLADAQSRRERDRDQAIDAAQGLHTAVDAHAYERTVVTLPEVHA